MQPGDENKKKPPPVAAAAAAASSDNNNDNDDATLAQALHAVESLVQIFGFSYDAANEAVNNVGIDVTTCYNYILDQGLGQDQGGPIYPIDPCIHVTRSLQSQLPKSDTNDTTTTNTDEIAESSISRLLAIPTNNNEKTLFGIASNAATVRAATRVPLMTVHHCFLTGHESLRQIRHACY